MNEITFANHSPRPIQPRFAAIILAGAALVSNLMAEPISVGDRTSLFLDDQFIAEQSGLRRTWHQGKPQPEPAITGQWPCLFGSVLYDPQTGLYKLWYEDLANGANRIYYAESKDGKRWTKPALGLVEINGSKSNNCIWPHAEGPNVFLDPNDADPGGRFKMFLWTFPSKIPQSEPAGHVHVLLRSGDGIHWEPVGPRPEIQLPEGDESAQARVPRDTNEIIWDALRRRYLGTFRHYPLHPGLPGWFRNEKYEVSDGLGGHRRAIGVATSMQLSRGWSRMTTALKADAQDDAKVAKLSRNEKLDWAELYCMPVFTYGNHYLGLLSLLYWVDGIHGSDTTEGSGDLQFTFSHDGEKWFRQPDRQTLVAPATPGLVPCYAQSNEPLDLGDELWIYYTEAEAAHPKSHHKSFIRAAVWRKDGFVSLDAAGKGSLTTHPLAFTGHQLLVNSEGVVTVAVLDEHGARLKGFKPQTLKGNSVLHPVAWDLSSSAGKPLRLRFDIQRGRLWSFRFAG